MQPNHFTPEFCAISFCLAAAIGTPAQSLEDSAQRENFIQGCIAWLNVHALTCGKPWLMVSENSTSGALH